MNKKKDKVLIIRSTNYRDADKILQVFGREFGKYSIIAKGVRKIKSKNRGNIQTMSLAEISFLEGKNMGVLIESKLIIPPDFGIEKFSNIKRLLNFINKQIPEDFINKVVFDLLELILKKGLNAKDIDIFRLNVLYLEGFIDDFRCCSKCRKKENLSWIDKNNLSMFCSDCQREKAVNFISLDDIKKKPTLLTSLIDDFIEGMR